MRLYLNNTVFVVVDIQERLFPHIHEHLMLEQNCHKLLSGVRILEAPLIVTEQYPKGLGPTISSIQSELSEIKPIEKITFSCCANEEFTGTLKNLGRHNVILCGIEAHVCVLQTAIDLKEMGFQPVVVVDCISSRRQKDKEVALIRLQQENVLITNYESVLFELCSVAGTDTFKAISHLVK
jgi:nicotinamidase-related amidase